ncbi:o-succinylbenzoate synthase [Alicyclobacillus dauci]|uniref:o-succinylbenzoate synthase n=1 Tax=Alicyclobacillus dauci TaxID=1475485 RepID=A0ABY6Z9B3_9BACL|nr:o-succinylbenzoate synthase [Alicyclobacillus dauci]
MDVCEIVIHRLVMPLQMRFETSFGVQTDRDVILLEVRTQDGYVGWGESVAARSPLYNEETTDTVEAILRKELIPLALNTKWAHPSEFFKKTLFLHGNRMAKFALEGALWDIWAQQQGLPLAQAIGGTKSKVDVGVSIGIKPIPELLQEIEDYYGQGYRRIKIKIRPGWDTEPVAAVRQKFPHVPLMVDANAAYDENHFPTLLELDKYGLMMIEQPLADNAWEEYANLQSQLETPLCLDESIHTLEDALRAIHMKACRIINVKLGRVGGIQAALELTKVAKEAGIQLWCGGMLETGVGRALNIAIATLDGFTLPGDTAASARYWNPDIILPEVTVTDGQITVPPSPGLGYSVNIDQIARYQEAQWHFRA